MIRVIVVNADICSHWREDDDEDEKEREKRNGAGAGAKKIRQKKYTDKENLKKNIQ